MVTLAGPTLDRGGMTPKKSGPERYAELLKKARAHSFGSFDEAKEYATSLVEQTKKNNPQAEYQGGFDQYIDNVASEAWADNAEPSAAPTPPPVAPMAPPPAMPGPMPSQAPQDPGAGWAAIQGLRQAKAGYFPTPNRAAGLQALMRTRVY